MNFLELANRTQARAQDSGAHVFTLAEVKGYVNDAYMDVVAARFDWPFMETRRSTVTVPAGAGFVALPADVWHVGAVFNATAGIPMDPIHSRTEPRDLFPHSTTGAPTLYRLLGPNLEVYPSPGADTTIELDAFAPPAELSGDTDEPAFPRQHHRILVSGALSFLYEDDGNQQAAAGHRARFEQGIQRLAMDMFAPRHEGYPGIVDLGV